MRALRQFPMRFGNAPATIIVAVVLLLLAGIGIILQNEGAYRDLQVQETRAQADILAASVSAPLDFSDREAARESVSLIQANRQIRTIGVYDRQGALLAGYGRDGAAPPGRYAEPFMTPDNAIAAVVPVASRGERIGTVYIAANPEPIRRRLTRYLVIGLLVVMAALVVGVLGFAQAALRQVNRELAARAEALSQANEELQFQISERTKAEDQLRQAHKMQALGQLTGGIAHDFNNLLTVIQGSADMLRRPELDDAKRLRFAEAVVQAASRAAALTGQLLAFARRQPLRPEIIDVDALIGDMTDLLDRTLGERIEVRTLLACGSCRVEADRAQLESALLNIAVNARDAMPEGGLLTIRTGRESAADGADMVTIAVSDTGAGMDAETRERAFEPFFTTKATGKGTGLGLSQVYGFATQSGGEVRIESGGEAGTTVTLSLPLTTAEETKRDDAAGIAAPSSRTGRILLVEDNEEVGEFAEALLKELGHQVVRVRSAEAALATALEEAPDAVFSDVVMPGMSGLELAAELGRMRPALPVILTTGYSGEIAESGSGGRPILLKPYRLETLAAALDQVLAPEGR